MSFIQERNDIEVIVVDEAHRFRNQDTEAYELLSMICKNRKVILLTATPFNNSPADIFSLLKLFIVPGKSQLTVALIFQWSLEIIEIYLNVLMK